MSQQEFSKTLHNNIVPADMGVKKTTKDTKMKPQNPDDEREKLKSEISRLKSQLAESQRHQRSLSNIATTENNGNTLPNYESEERFPGFIPQYCPLREDSTIIRDSAMGRSTTFTDKYFNGIDLPLPEFRSSLFEPNRLPNPEQNKLWRHGGRAGHMRAMSWEQNSTPAFMSKTNGPKQSRALVQNSNMHKRTISNFVLPRKNATPDFKGTDSECSSDFSALSGALDNTSISSNRKTNFDTASFESGLSFTTTLGSDYSTSDLSSDFGTMVDVLLVQIINCSDQHASFVLQNKLDHGDSSEVDVIMQKVIDHCVLLMTSRFGNFLIQKCMTLCSAWQFEQIYQIILENLSTLAVDGFGCHPVQKCLELASAEKRITIIDELLKIVDLTICHRYGYRTWQRLFQIPDMAVYFMPKLNEIFKGRWPEIAQQEYGSLIVQNIFESCSPKEVSMCCAELLDSLAPLIKSKHGHWVVLHILEHNQPKFRQLVGEFLVNVAFEYSEDQFAAKVIEKAIRIEQSTAKGATPFTNAYVDRLIQQKSGSNWMPLVHVASDRYGNYIVQCLLREARRDTQTIVAKYLRKQMVSLRGSKFGQKVTALLGHVK